jgi:hypothetical protein
MPPLALSLVLGAFRRLAPNILESQALGESSNTRRCLDAPASRHGLVTLGDQPAVVASTILTFVRAYDLPGLCRSCELSRMPTQKVSGRVFAKKQELGPSATVYTGECHD